MPSALDDPHAAYLVLVNEEGQHSLWPVPAGRPAGWTIAYGPAGRAECLDYVTAHWTDMRPRRLAARLRSGI